MRTGSPVSSIVGNVASSSSKNTRPSSRARCTPRQKCSAMPNDRCGFGRAVDVEALRVVEHVLVAVGRRVEHRHLVARRDRRRRAARCRRWRCAGSSAAGWPSAGSPRPRRGSATGRRAARRAGRGARAARSRPDDSIVLVVSLPGGDELHEEAAEVDVGHRARRRSRSSRISVVRSSRGASCRRAAANSIAYIAMSIDARRRRRRRRRRGRGPGRWCCISASGGSAASRRSGRPMSSADHLRRQRSTVTSCTNSTSPCSAASAMISPADRRGSAPRGRR